MKLQFGNETASSGENGYYDDCKNSSASAEIIEAEGEEATDEFEEANDDGVVASLLQVLWQREARVLELVDDVVFEVNLLYLDSLEPEGGYVSVLALELLVFRIHVECLLYTICKKH